MADGRENDRRREAEYLQLMRAHETQIAFTRQNPLGQLGGVGQAGLLARAQLQGFGGEIGQFGSACRTPLPPFPIDKKQTGREQLQEFITEWVKDIEI